jgi:hypothetical protein
MNHTHLPRSFVILLFILVAASFFFGITRAFTPAHAVSVANATPTPALSTTPTESETEKQSPTPTSIPEPLYFSDMTGIIALGILMVVVILIGVAWGIRHPNRNKEPGK